MWHPLPTILDLGDFNAGVGQLLDGIFRLAMMLEDGNDGALEGHGLVLFLDVGSFKSFYASAVSAGPSLSLIDGRYDT